MLQGNLFSNIKPLHEVAFYLKEKIVISFSSLQTEQCFSVWGKPPYEVAVLSGQLYHVNRHLR